MTRTRLWLLGALLPLALVAAAGCQKKEGAAKDDRPEVVVSPPLQESASDHIDLTGTVASSKSAVLMARVPGYLRSVDFTDGTFVKEGQQLFLIEPEPYEQQLRLAEAALLQAQSEYERQVGLMKENATSKAAVEKWLSQRDQAAAQVELARINLGYTRVTAPFSGRIGRSQVDPGNLIDASGNTKLAVIDQVTPIHVYFNLNERDALEIRKLMRRLNIKPGEPIGKAKVLIGLQNEEGYPHEGVLDFVDSGVDAATGSVEMRALVPNEDRALFPGLFTRVRIPLGDPRPRLIVPARAIANDQEGDHVFVVTADDTVVRRAVIKGAETPAGTVITSGLASSDRVIVTGFSEVTPGMKVRPVAPAAAVPAEGAAALQD